MAYQPIGQIQKSAIDLDGISISEFNSLDGIAQTSPASSTSTQSIPAIDDAQNGTMQPTITPTDNPGYPSNDMSSESMLIGDEFYLAPPETGAFPI